MRIEERLHYSFVNIGFTKVNMESERVNLFYRARGHEVDLIAIIDVLSGEEIKPYEYEMITKDIKHIFVSFGFKNICFLGLIITKRPDLAKNLILEEDNHWLVDLNSMRLYIYEDQGNDLLDVREVIEDSLEEGSYGELYKYYRKPEERVTFFTLFNTGIIILNILIYILVHNTNILGNTGEVMAKGALSWLFIKEEGQYYRILTSMFLHSNFSHLINNMLVLLFVGDKLERVAGKIRYLIIYFGSGFLAGSASIVYNMLNDKDALTLSVGASGAIFGIVGAMLYALIRNRGRIEGISSRQIILFVVFSLYGGLSSQRIDNAAHIGGFIGGILLAIILYIISKILVRKEGSP